MHVIRNESGPGVVIPHFSNVSVRDQHNIQLGYKSPDRTLEAIKANRNLRPPASKKHKVARAKKLF